ncbi:MAG: hypothetical protein JSR58_05955 [Verrucomicrobia bacterium]|nr:hypothetical protein [Verrucomicrobiota bacterium]
MSNKIEQVSRFFETFDKPANFDQVRNTIPRLKEDPLLTQIVQTENRIITTIKTNGNISETLIQEGFEKKTVEVIGRKRTRETVDVWEGKDTHKRLCMDNSTAKVNGFISKLKNVTEQDRVISWPTYTLNRKTCTSILKPTDATFCGSKEGALVYLAPAQETAVLSAAPCDVVSPSEINDAKAQKFQSARETTEMYCNDLAKYRLAFDLVEEVKSEAIKILSNVIEVGADENASLAKSALFMLQQKGPSIFDKNIFTDKPIFSNLELEIDHIIAAIDTYPMLEALFSYKRSDFIRLNESVKKYVRDPKVVNRGVQKIETTGWELTHDKKNEDHPLHPKAHVVHRSLELFQNDLSKHGITIDNLSQHTKAIDEGKQEGLSFIEKKKKTYDQQVYLSSVNGMTVTEAVEMKEKHQQVALTRLNTIEKEIAKKKPSLSQQFQQIVDKAESVVQSAKKPFENLYTEIQVQSDQMQISGFGIKSEVLSQMQTHDYEVIVTNYHNAKDVREKIAQLEQDLQDIKDLNEFTDFSQTISKAKVTADKVLEDLRKDSLIANHRLIKKSSKHKLPCFVHKHKQ